MIYFQIFTTFRYKSLKNSEMLVAFLGGDGGKSDKNVECAKECPLPSKFEQWLPSKIEQLKIICKGNRRALLAVEWGVAERNGEQGTPAAFHPNIITNFRVY